MIRRILIIISDWLKQLSYKLKNCKKAHFARGCAIGSEVFLEGGNVLNYKTVLFGHSCLGYGSYIGAYSALGDVQIGKYSCIADYVTIISGKHPTETFVSIHPAFYSLHKQAGFTYVEKQKYNEYARVGENGSFSVQIGNDVWIGSHVLLMEGISIGDGAVIAAGSVVVKDVPPYAVVGGCPAKLIRYRFKQDQIDYLLRLQWWNRGEEWIRSHAEQFENVTTFLEAISDE